MQFDDSRLDKVENNREQTIAGVRGGMGGQEDRGWLRMHDSCLYFALDGLGTFQYLQV